MHKPVAIWTFFFCGALLCSAQPAERFHAFSYSVNEGLLQSTIGDMVIDKNNYCWIAFPNGLQKFDGKNFIRIPVQPGLPDDTKTTLFGCASGDVLVSHSGGISRYEKEKDGFLVMYAKGKNDNGHFSFLGECEGVVYFLKSDAVIVGINSQTGKPVTSTATNLPAVNHDSKTLPSVSNVVEGCVAIVVQGMVYLWNLPQQKLVGSYRPPASFATFAFCLASRDEILFRTLDDRYPLARYNFTAQEVRRFNPGASIPFISRLKLLPWREKRLLSLNNRLFVVDSTLRITGEMRNFQNGPFTPSGGFSKIVADRFGNLYLSTVINGLVKIMASNYPLKYFGAGDKAHSNVISILPDKKAARILAGTTTGLLVFDTAQQLIRQLNLLPGKTGSIGCNVIARESSGDYLVSIMGKNGGIFRLSKDLSALRPLRAQTESRGPQYFGNPLYQTSDEVVLQTQDLLYRIEPARSMYREHRFSTGYVLSGFYHQNTIIAHAFDELIFLNPTDFKEKGRLPLPGTGDVRCYVADKRGRIYLGTNNGLFVLDEKGKILERRTSQNGLPDNCIYAMAFDEEGLLWCSSNKGLFRLNGDGTILQLRKEDGLQENEFNTNAVAVAEDGELFFGGVNGISSFYPSNMKRHSEKLNVFLTGVKANNQPVFGDKAAWSLRTVTLPYDKNALSFDFVAMGGSNPDQYVYQYKMKGVDEEWVQNDGLQTVRYSLLPGRYVFQLHASRMFDKHAKPMQELVIVITPPFWQTWWFLGTVLAAVLGGIAFGVNRRNKNIYRKKLEALEAEHQLQTQRERISRDLHDNIGAYANAVLYKTELLERNENDLHRMELMADLKFASKDIITSLRETVWALKKEEYTAEDCLLRIRNFMQTLSRYYPGIHFHVHGEAPQKKALHYTAALNAVRIAQEVITNGVKHASASAIHVSNAEENGTWVLTFTDDGKGFDEAALAEGQKGDGLANLRKRAAESGFAIAISSEPGFGTAVTVRIP